PPHGGAPLQVRGPGPVDGGRAGSASEGHSEHQGIAVIAIVDYGIGNLGSVTKGFRHAGAETVLTDDPTVLRSADALVLPGDGAFGATMDEVRRRGLVPLLREAAERGRPLLGICIGM